MCMFCRSLFVLFLLAIVLSSSIYGFWLPLWYLQTLLIKYCGMRLPGCGLSLRFLEEFVLLDLKVLYVCVVDGCLSFCLFSFGHCVVCSPIYGFWLLLWYLQTLLEHCVIILRFLKLNFLQVTDRFYVMLIILQNINQMVVYIYKISTKLNS